MIFKKLLNIIVGLLVIFYSTLAGACVPENIFKNIKLKEMFRDAIFNNVRKSNFYFNFLGCDLICAVNLLNKSDVKYTISGSVITYKTDQFGLSTMVLDDPAARSLSGYLTCNARGNWQYIKIPISFGRSKPVMDFQSRDAFQISRSISLINVSKEEYLRQMTMLKNRSSNIEISKGYKTINLNDGNNVLVIDSELSRGKLTYVFIQ